MSVTPFEGEQLVIRAHCTGIRDTHFHANLACVWWILRRQGHLAAGNIFQIGSAFSKHSYVAYVPQPPAQTLHALLSCQQDTWPFQWHGPSSAQTQRCPKGRGGSHHITWPLSSYDLLWPIRWSEFSKIIYSSKSTYSDQLEQSNQVTWPTKVFGPIRMTILSHMSHDDPPTFCFHMSHSLSTSFSRPHWILLSPVS